MGCLLHSVWFGIFHECCLKMLRFVHNQYQSWGQGKALGRTSGEEMRAQSSVIYSLHLDHWDVFAPPRAAGVREGPRVSLLGCVGHGADREGLEKWDVSLRHHPGDLPWR